MSGDEVQIDLTGYKDKMGERVIPGRYRVIVEDTEVDVSSNQNQMINVWLRVVGTAFDGATIVDRLVLTDKSLFRVVGFMQAIGLPTPKRRLRVNVGTWKGRTLEVDVDDGDPYMGRIKSEVRGYLKIEKAGGAADLEDVAGSEAATVPVDDGAGGGLAEFAPREPVVSSGEGVPDEVDLDTLDLG